MNSEDKHWLTIIEFAATAQFLVSFDGRIESADSSEFYNVENYAPATEFDQFEFRRDAMKWSATDWGLYSNYYTKHCKNLI